MATANQNELRRIAEQERQNLREARIKNEEQLRKREELNETIRHNREAEEDVDKSRTKDYIVGLGSAGIKAGGRILEKYLAPTASATVASKYLLKSMKVK